MNIASPLWCSFVSPSSLYVHGDSNVDCERVRRREEKRWTNDRWDFVRKFTSRKRPIFDVRSAPSRAPTDLTINRH